MGVNRFVFLSIEGIIECKKKDWKVVNKSKKFEGQHLAVTYPYHNTVDGSLNSMPRID